MKIRQWFLWVVKRLCIPASPLSRGHVGSLVSACSQRAVVLNAQNMMWCFLFFFLPLLSFDLVPLIAFYFLGGLSVFTCCSSAPPPVPVLCYQKKTHTQNPSSRQEMSEPIAMETAPKSLERRPPS